jgi:hypothetical protein
MVLIALWLRLAITILILDVICLIILIYQIIKLIRGKM